MGVVTDHARQRMAERLGRDATGAEWRQVIGDIRSRRAVLAAVGHRESSRREVWLVALGDLLFRVVWQPDQATIITVLPASDPRRAGVRIRALLQREGPRFLRGRRRRSDVIENR
jgi:hypothetical protein